MEKVIKDGKVAVLVSYGYGAGWYSWNTDHKEILFHPKLVEMVENGDRDKITDELIKELLGIDVYCGGAEGLRVEWLDEGTCFEIIEYDGAENLEIKGDKDWAVA